MSEYRGHKTMPDGSHVPLSPAEAKDIWEAVEKNTARKAEMMPTSKEAISLMFDAFDRLRTLGWRGGAYCPKDGTPFAAIQHGSTGIFTGSFNGEWPYDFAYIEDEGTHPHGFIWKPLDQLTDWEEEQRKKSQADTEAYLDRMAKAFGDPL
jgi:hypothetical protein